MASLQYNPPQSPTPLDVHLPEDEELLTYLEEFSPCGPDGCELPGANSNPYARRGPNRYAPAPQPAPATYTPNPQHQRHIVNHQALDRLQQNMIRRPSLDYGPNHHAAARAAAMAAGDPYHYQSGYGNPGMDRNQNTSAPGSHYSRSSNRDSISQNSVLHHAMTNNSGRSSPYIGQQRSASARTTSTTGSTLSGDPTAMPPPPYSFDSMYDHHQQQQQQQQHHDFKRPQYNDYRYQQHQQQQQHQMAPIPMIRTNSLASPLMPNPSIRSATGSTITATTRTTPYPASINSTSTNGSSAGHSLYSPTAPTRTITAQPHLQYAPRGTQSLDLDRRSLMSSGSDSGYSEEEEVDPASVLNQYGGNQLTFTENETPTLYELLKPYVPSLEQATAEFAAFQTLMGWFMGSGSGGITHYAHWKPCARGMQFALPRLINMPKTDLGVSWSFLADRVGRFCVGGSFSKRWVCLWGGGFEEG